MRPVIRLQLVVLALVTVIAVTVMVVGYLQIPALVGVNRMTVTAELPAGGGLYEQSNVTYRGVTVGTVKSVAVQRDGVKATMQIDDEYRIPREGLRVNVHSMSAIGEQYIDLVPAPGATGPDLGDGDVLPADTVTLPAQIGPVLQQANDLLASIPPGKLHTLIDASFRSFVGTRDDLIKLVASLTQVADIADQNADSTDELIRELGPFLEPHGESREAIATWSDELARFTSVLKDQDLHVRAIIDNSPVAAAGAQRLIEDVRPTVPILLSNLVSLGQVAAIYNAGIEQIFVLMPPLIAGIQSMVNRGMPDESVIAQFHTMASPLCTTGFLPADQRRSPADLTKLASPVGQYCSIPQNAPMNVRGARNLPCMEVPGKRAPTPEQCRDPRGYQPKGQWPSSIDGSGSPDRQGLTTGVQPSAYDPATGDYAAPDGSTYHHRTIQGGASWHELLSNPIN